MHGQGRTTGLAAHHTCASIDRFPATEQRDQRCAIPATARAGLEAPARKNASWCVQNARQEALVQQHMAWNVSAHTVQALFTNVPHALQFDTSKTACETRAHTESAPKQARSACSHLPSSADHVLLFTMNLNICGHTFSMTTCSY